MADSWIIDLMVDEPVQTDADMLRPALCSPRHHQRRTGRTVAPSSLSDVSPAPESD